MSAPFTIKIDGHTAQAAPGQTVLEVARNLGLDIPTLCYLEKCGPLNSCLVCLVKINGKLVPSCGTRAEPGMTVESESEEVHQARRTALELLFSDHVGDCLAPCHRLCPLGLNIPLMMRQVQAGQQEQALITVRGALPLPSVLGRLCHHPCEQGCRRGNWDDPAAIRDLERFVTAPEVSASPQSWQSRHVPPRRQATGKSVMIVGAGPTGLAAAYYLARYGHEVIVSDRNEAVGGALRRVPEADLAPAAIECEADLLRRLGVTFKPGVELGKEVTVDGLSRSFDALLLATGEKTAEQAATLGLPLAGPGLKVDPNTCQAPLAKVFAAGAAVKPVKQLVRAMAEGRAAAECIHRFLSGQHVRRPEKVFTSIMGRLSPGELKDFLAAVNLAGKAGPCDRCAGLNRTEARHESSRCLHCDCRSSGNCLLQHYAQVYGAEAGRFRAERRPFEQQRQPGGVIFEPGKCILCGLCVKLTEMAREPLGLAFIGRGFNVRVAAPMNHTIQEGLQRTAAECVEHCPTGALSFAEVLAPAPEKAPSS